MSSKKIRYDHFNSRLIIEIEKNNISLSHTIPCVKDELSGDFDYYICGDKDSDGFMQCEKLDIKPETVNYYCKPKDNILPIYYVDNIYEDHAPTITFPLLYHTILEDLIKAGDGANKNFYDEKLRELEEDNICDKISIPYLEKAIEYANVNKSNDASKDAKNSILQSIINQITNLATGLGIDDQSDEIIKLFEKKIYGTLNICDGGYFSIKDPPKIKLKLRSPQPPGKQRRVAIAQKLPIFNRIQDLLNGGRMVLFEAGDRANLNFFGTIFKDISEINQISIPLMKKAIEWATENVKYDASFNAKVGILQFYTSLIREITKDIGIDENSTVQYILSHSEEEATRDIERYNRKYKEYIQVVVEVDSQGNMIRELEQIGGSIDYKSKYLKYKEKYLSLKK